MQRTSCYQGVDAHLMDYLQGKDRYRSFHAAYIINLVQYLNAILPEQYTARGEDTLRLTQVTHNGKTQSKWRFPDVTVWERQPSAPQSSAVAAAIDLEPDLYIPFPEPEEVRRPLSAVIYDDQKAILVIELLSPGNKADEQSRAEYRDKRYGLLHLDLVLVEIDLLHSTPALMSGMPLYPQDEGSTPYFIALSDPRKSDQTAIYRFGIHHTMPTLRLPLVEPDSVVCAFNEVYHETFKRGRYRQELDYQHEPLSVHTYAPADQATIRQVTQDCVNP